MTRVTRMAALRRQKTTVTRMATPKGPIPITVAGWGGAGGYWGIGGVTENRDHISTYFNIHVLIYIYLIV